MFFQNYSCGFTFCSIHYTFMYINIYIYIYIYVYTYTYDCIGLWYMHILLTVDTIVFFWKDTTIMKFIIMYLYMYVYIYYTCHMFYILCDKCVHIIWTVCIMRTIKLSVQTIYIYVYVYCCMYRTTTWYHLDLHMYYTYHAYMYIYIM